MRVKKYIIYAVLAALALIAIYTGITFIATLTKAITQPHLESAVKRFDFLGFYMLSGTYGAITFGIIIVIIVIIILMKKFMKKEAK